MNDKVYPANISMYLCIIISKEEVGKETSKKEMDLDVFLWRHTADFFRHFVILQRWIVCLGKGLDIQLNFKVIIWQFHWGLQTADARLPSPGAMFTDKLSKISLTHPTLYFDTDG